VFASLMIVVMRGHRAQNESRSKLQQLLVHEHMLVSELDQRNADLKLADESRLRLLSVVTHELGNPLTSISAFAGMLMKNKEENLSDRQLSMVAAINRGETQMRALVKDLLDLSRVEADELELELANLDVREIIDGSIDSMNPIFDAKFQTITSSADSDSISIDGDRTRLNQVITNLLSNASKYSPEGSNISVNTYSNESIFVTEITDDGIGISTEDKLQLFTPFFRSDNSETRQVPGNGLGLVICKQIVELHGGSLTVDSTKGQGTTVRVELPMLKLGESSVDAA